MKAEGLTTEEQEYVNATKLDNGFFGYRCKGSGAVPINVWRKTTEVRDLELEGLEGMSDELADYVNREVINLSPERMERIKAIKEVL